MICYNEFIDSLVNQLFELWMITGCFLIVGMVVGTG